MTSPISPPAVLTVSVLLAALGLPAGAVARRVLGRLRRGARVPPPWCEAGVALTWSTVGATVGGGVVPARWLPVLLGLGWLAVAAGAVDVLHQRLPDALTLPALPLALLLLVPLGAEVVLRAGLGAVVAGTQRETDPDRLFRDTLIPRVLWKVGFVVVAIVCLWKGAQLLVP